MSQVQHHTISTDADGQRVDNYLFKLLASVPRTHIYKLMRQGQFRLNKKRIKATTRVAGGDILRIPPINIETKPFPKTKYTPEVLFEDDTLLVVNKPAGMAVHGGSGLSWGMVELLRAQFEADNLSLVHRLDKDTSGVLVLAKTTSALRTLSETWGDTTKEYVALVKGHFAKERVVTAKLRKNILSSGERMVRVSDDGKESLTTFEPIESFAVATLVKATLGTGRTHQIRVHAQSIGHPLVADEKYGDSSFNTRLAKKGFKRLCLHARQITLAHPKDGKVITIEAPMPKDLLQIKERL